jgi:Glu-tRNA(Gln) amidotransferase subunit E-like FAD-binding protein
VENAKVQIPEFSWERRKRLSEWGLSEQLINELIDHPRFHVFENMAEISGDAVWAARLVAETIKFLKRKGHDINRITDDVLIELATLYKAKRFYREGTNDILRSVCRNGLTVENAIEETIFKVPAEETELIADELIYDDDGPANPEKRRRYHMGMAMRKYRGAIPGKTLWEKISSRKISNT